MEEKELPTPLRGYSKEKKFYVYIHKRPDGSVFYVGKGHGKRAWVKKSRNNHWNNVVEKYGGFDVEIVYKDLDEQESFAKEIELIKHYGMDNLTNQTLGGLSTTGFRHSEETIKLQSEIGKQRLVDNKEWAEAVYERMRNLHYKQINDPEYKERMSIIQKQAYARLSDEEKALRAEKRVQWLLDPVKKKEAFDKLRETIARPEVKAAAKKKGREVWDSKTDEEKQIVFERLLRAAHDPTFRDKMKDLFSKKLVVNRSFVFKSKKLFSEFTSSKSNVTLKAFYSAKKFGFDFCVSKGMFLEEYDQELHSNIPLWNGEEIKKLDFDCLPRSKAVVMDEQRTFLTMVEASKFCGGKTVEATADFITKNIKLNKPAMGHLWRVATNEEIKTEILRRLENIRKED